MRYFLVTFFLLSSLWAHECSDRLFSLQAYTHQGDGIRLVDVLRDISVRCGVSVDFEDNRAKRVATLPLDFVNVKNYTFTEFLDFLAQKKNLFFDFDEKRGVIHLSYLKTKSFPIDYVNVTRIESTNSKVIATGVTSFIRTQSDNQNQNYNNDYRSVRLGDYNNRNTNQGSTSLPPADTTMIDTKLTFTFWDTLEQNIRNLATDDGFQLVINKDASLITVTATRKDMTKVQAYIKQLLQRMHQQVMIEAKFIELIYDSSHQEGIDWSKFLLQIQGNVEGFRVRNAGTVLDNFKNPDYFIGYNFTTEALFDFLRRYGKISILSSPKVMTLNNQPAIINVGMQLSYKYQTGTVNTAQNATPVGTTTYTIGSTFVGITLFVIPEVTEDGQIIMRINPVISDTDNPVDSNTIRELPPDTRIRQLTSIVKVSNGAKVLIGGLISFQKNTDNTKVPLLGDIPLLGRAFHATKKQLQKKELFILLTPRIVKKDSMPTIDELELLGEGK